MRASEGAHIRHRSPMAEVLHKNLEKIENSDILTKLGLKEEVYPFVG